ncbi:protein of unknown function [Fontimonas thermophila]|uniref:DUF4426 domain-containing protein n=1 Tax=Fontimonas thermophila TaxID=1076937 RepID=A0A1I2J1A6_9GAMM|nr:DUF4426 domain-containing protein [Fontimonas thermophila]SFF48435.1 protein of unknown function [Fontimonas thermophila]
MTCGSGSHPVRAPAFVRRWGRAGAWLAALMLGWHTLVAQAEQYVEAGDFRVHYAVINTTELTPEVARQFGVERTGNRILLVLNAQQRVDGRFQPVPATASGTATTLLGHVQTLRLRPVREADVHYVIASFETLDGEFMTIDVRVLPAGANAPIPIRFRQQFYRN